MTTKSSSSSPRRGKSDFRMVKHLIKRPATGIGSRGSLCQLRPKKTSKTQGDKEEEENKCDLLLLPASGKQILAATNPNVTSTSSTTAAGSLTTNTAACDPHPVVGLVSPPTSPDPKSVQQLATSFTLTTTTTASNDTRAVSEVATTSPPQQQEVRRSLRIFTTSTKLQTGAQDDELLSGAAEHKSRAPTRSPSTRYADFAPEDSSVTKSKRSHGRLRRIGGQRQSSLSAAESSSRSGRGAGAERTKPRRRLSAYNLFFQNQRQLILKQGRGTGGFKLLAKTIARRWHDTTYEERKPFRKLAEKDALRYEREMIEYEVSRRMPVSVALTQKKDDWRDLQDLTGAKTIIKPRPVPLVSSELSTSTSSSSSSQRKNKKASPKKRKKKQPGRSKRNLSAVVPQKAMTEYVETKSAAKSKKEMSCSPVHKAPAAQEETVSEEDISSALECDSVVDDTDMSAMDDTATKKDVSSIPPQDSVFPQISATFQPKRVSYNVSDELAQGEEEEGLLLERSDLEEEEFGWCDAAVVESHFCQDEEDPEQLSPSPAAVMDMDKDFDTQMQYHDSFSSCATSGTMVGEDLANVFKEKTEEEPDGAVIGTTTDDGHFCHYNNQVEDFATNPFSEGDSTGDGISKSAATITVTPSAMKQMAVDVSKATVDQLPSFSRFPSLSSQEERRQASAAPAKTETQDGNQSKKVATTTTTAAAAVPLLPCLSRFPSGMSNATMPSEQEFYCHYPNSPAYGHSPAIGSGGVGSPTRRMGCAFYHAPAAGTENQFLHYNMVQPPAFLRLPSIPIPTLPDTILQATDATTTAKTSSEGDDDHDTLDALEQAQINKECWFNVF